MAQGDIVMNSRITDDVQYMAVEQGTILRKLRPH